MNLSLLTHQHAAFMIIGMRTHRTLRTFPIVERLGGLNATFERLAAFGLPLKTKDAIRMWMHPERGVIPGDAVLAFMRICEAAGLAYSSRDFTIVDRPAPNASHAVDDGTLAGWMRAHGISDRVLAQQIDRAPRTVERLRRGLGFASAETARRIAAVSKGAIPQALLMGPAAAVTDRAA